MLTPCIIYSLVVFKAYPAFRLKRAQGGAQPNEKRITPLNTTARVARRRSGFLLHTTHGRAGGQAGRGRSRASPGGSEGAPASTTRAGPTLEGQDRPPPSLLGPIVRLGLRREAYFRSSQEVRRRLPGNRPRRRSCRGEAQRVAFLPRRQSGPPGGGRGRAGGLKAAWVIGQRPSGRSAALSWGGRWR